MKARFFALAALVLGLASCQNDFDGANVGVGGEVDFQLAVAAPEFGATRADEDGRNGYDSAFGAIDYLSETDWNNVDLRYSLEVYDYDPATKTIGDIVKDRMVKVLDKYEPVVFDLRLVPNRHYHFVVFADFVDEDATDVPTVKAQAEIGKHHIIGETLAKITLKKDAINNELTDAYFATAQFEIKNSAAKDMILRRPYGKVRVVATDLAELNLNVNPQSVQVDYTTYIPTTFNAVTGEVDTRIADKTYFAVLNVNKEDMSSHLYTDGYDSLYTTNANGDKRYTHVTLFTDYVLAEKEGQTPHHFTMTVFDDKLGQNPIKTTIFSTDIPVQRNHLTTVIGNVLTTGTEINISIDDNFYNGNNVEDKPYYQTIWDGVSIEEPTYDAATKTYTVESGAELAWIANEVNNGTTFEGKTVVLANDINLGGNEWTPIGGNGKHFTGTFDGKNFIVGDFEVTTQEGHAGLFGSARATIKNLKVAGVKIVSHHYAGAIVGQGYVKMDNCHVENVDITLTTKNGDWGDKAGGLVGQNCEGANMYITNSTAKNVKIQGYRDLGGIVGMAHNNNTVSHCHVENITILQDLSVNYEPTTPTTLGAVIGRKGSNVTDSNNTEGENIYVAVIVAEGLTQDTEDGTYSVTSVEGLAYIAEQVNDEGNTEIASSDIVLNGDIDLSAIASLFSATRGNASNWTPIGTSANPFTGTFDGNGCTIKNLVIDGGSNSNIGFFGYTTNGEIKNVTFENAKVSGRLNVGVVAGTPYTSKYTNITVKGHVEVNGMAYVGAVGGKNAYADWTNITVDVDATSYVNANSVENGTAYRTYVGGVVGFNGEGGHSFKNITSNINVKGSTCDVGGLFGIAHYGNKFENCVCTGNVEIYAAAEETEAQEIGGIAGVWHPGGENVIMNKCSFTGTLKANNNYVINTYKFGNLVCAAYNSNGAGKLIIDGVRYLANENDKVAVSTADELVAALEANKGVYLLNDIKIEPASMSNAYGTTGLNIKNGQTIDGGGHTINIKGAGGTWDSGINTTGGLIKNLTVTGSFRGIFINHTSTHSEKVVLENVTITGTTYTISCDQGLYQGIEATDCTFNGWTSFAKTAGEAKFVNCSFGEGNGYKYCRPYSNTEFVGCTFCPGYTVDTTRATVTFTDCIWE